jgi:ankyrin repeat protein
MGDVDWQVKSAIVAAMHGNLEELRRLVQQDRQLLDAQWGELTPLTVAARRGNLEVVRYLLDEGADINLQPRDDGTGILEEACMNGLLELVTLLLARGAYTGPDNMGWTPLMAASSQGHTDVAKLLLAHGCCNVDDRTYGRATTALHSACFRERAGVVGLLLEAGADPCLEDEDGITPLADVMRRGHVDCVAVVQVSTMSACPCYGSLSRAFMTCKSAHYPRRIPPSCRSGSATISCSRPAASAMPLPR